MPARLPRRASAWTALVVAGVLVGSALWIWIFTLPLCALDSDEAAVSQRPGSVFLARSSNERRERARLLSQVYARLVVGGFVVYVPRT